MLFFSWRLLPEDDTIPKTNTKTVNNGNTTNKQIKQNNSNNNSNKNSDASVNNVSL